MTSRAGHCIFRFLVGLFCFTFLSFFAKVGARELTSTPILLVRHGLSGLDPNSLEGHRNPLLTPIGEQQAKELSQYLGYRNTKIQAIYCSDLVRALGTARILASSFNLEAIPHKALRSRRKNLDNCEVETKRQVLERSKAYLAEIATSHPGQTLIVVSHSSLINTLLKALFEAQGRQPLSAAIDNCSVIELRYDVSNPAQSLTFVTLHYPISIEPYLHRSY